MKTKNLTTKILLTFSFFLLSIVSFAQWQPQISATILDLQSVFFADNDNGWAVGTEGIILHSDNGGDTWNEQVSGTDFDLESVSFINPDNGWIAGGKEGYPQTGIILRTVNGGGTWEEMYFDSSFYLNDVYFPDNLNGWAVGDAHVYMGIWGTLLHSIDGGETWVKQDSIPPYSWPFSLPLRGVHFIDPDNGWVVGGSMAPSSGYIYSLIMNTNDAGITWEEQINYSSYHNYWLNSVYFADTLNGWAAGAGPWGQNAIILKTIDGGNNWDTSYLNNSPALHSIYFAGSIKGWAVGSSGTIMHTSNGGDTWEAQPSGTTEGLNSVCFIDPENGWIAGDTGTILHTDNGGIVQIPNYQKPNSKIHLQNYPNPFSTSTTIEYELSEPGTAEIKIYNQIGQVIKEFVHQESRVGINKLIWQTEDMPSGIYFIRLQICKGIITKKIIKH